ncbi:MAG TPA: metallophosphoesterase family protein [Ktedonobacterales bacterium]|nr:metallophosphoesterase family protein [Ktedonobacterales bacterium]
MTADEPVYVIGDIHGQLGKLIALLRGAGLATDRLSWAAGAATLWFMGDFFDRGPDGLGVLDLVMRLQREAAVAGGQVASLLGNHEVMLLAAQRFAGRPRFTRGYQLKRTWEEAGGVVRDLAGLTPQHIDWLTDLPAMALVGGHLFMHANALFYREYGSSVEAVNAAIRKILQGEDAPVWARLIAGFRTRGFFNDNRAGGKTNAREFLRRYGGRRIIHGHVPIFHMNGQAAKDITEPYIYADGLCLDMDGGMSADGLGFVYQLPRLDAAL